MGGTVRTLNPAVRDLMEKRLVEVVEGTAALYGAKATCTYERMYPVTSNHAAETDFAASVARQISGDKGVITNVPPVMGPRISPSCWKRGPEPSSFWVLARGLASIILNMTSMTRSFPLA